MEGIEGSMLRICSIIIFLKVHSSVLSGYFDWASSFRGLFVVHERVRLTRSGVLMSGICPIITRGLDHRLAIDIIREGGCTVVLLLVC